MLHAAAIVVSMWLVFFFGGSGHVMVAKKTNRMLFGCVGRLFLECIEEEMSKKAWGPTLKYIIL